MDPRTQPKNELQSIVRSVRIKARGEGRRGFQNRDALDAIAVLVDRGLGVSILPDWAPPWPEVSNFKRSRLMRPI
jgi:hypothetical protein